MNLMEKVVSFQRRSWEKFVGLVVMKKIDGCVKEWREREGKGQDRIRRRSGVGLIMDPSLQCKKKKKKDASAPLCWGEVSQ